MQCSPRRAALRPSLVLFVLGLLIGLRPPMLQATNPSLDDELVGIGDLRHLVRLGQVEISPDGKQVIYTASWIVESDESDDEDDSGSEESETDLTYRTHLFRVPVDGSAPPRQLTRGETGATSPVWSPDGASVAFSRPTDDGTQIFLLPLDGGEARQVTEADHGAFAPRFSPDGKRLLFLSSTPLGELLEVEGSNAWPSERAGRSEVEPDPPGSEASPADPDGDVGALRRWLDANAEENDPRVLTRLSFQGEMDLSPEPSFTHVFVTDLESGETRRLTRGFRSFFGVEWSADGERLFATTTLEEDRHPDRNLQSSLVTVALDGSGFTPLLTLPDTNLGNPLPSPDGRTLAFSAFPQDTPGFVVAELGTVAVDGSGARLLTERFDRSVGSPRWSPDGKWLFFTASSNGGVPLYRIGATGGAPERLTERDAGVRGFAVGSDRMVFVKTEVANPYELYQADFDGGPAKVLSRHNSAWLEGKSLSYPEARKLTRRDGTVVEYWIMKPTRFEAGERYPLLLEIHGGPMAMWGPGEATMWHEFQVMAARGFGIVYANPRGSGGYGKAFRRGNFQNWGEGPGGDVLAAATEAAKEPWVDPARQVVTGGSYAGYLTAWIVGNDHRFKAAVAQRGVYELTTFLGEGNAWRLVPWHFGGYPWQEDILPILRRESPLTYVDQIRTPLLILHADNDLRTGVIQSEMLYRSLKILERPVEYVRYPDAGHDLSRTGDPDQRLDRLGRILEFFSRFVELGGQAGSGD